jgi:2'-5' RNA ligase
VSSSAGPARSRTSIDRARCGSASAALEERLAAAGWPTADKPFRPHLTVARVEGAAAAGTARRLVDAAADLEVASPVDRLVLFESITGQGPARYEPVATAPLGAPETGLHGSASRR